MKEEEALHSSNSKNRAYDLFLQLSQIRARGTQPEARLVCMAFLCLKTMHRNRIVISMYYVSFYDLLL